MNHALRLAYVADDLALRGRQTDLAHGLFEEEAIFGHFHSPGFRADHLHFVFVENAALRKFHGNVQGRLAPNGRQQRVRPFPFDNRFDEFLRQRFDVRVLGKFGIRHDRCRIRVHKNDFVPFLSQRLARLRSRVVEFARLSDHDRTGPDDENFRDVGALGHYEEAEFGFRISDFGFGEPARARIFQIRNPQSAIRNLISVPSSLRKTS